MKVFVWPEKTREELGSERWDVEWYELRPEKRNADTTQENDDFDYDRDLIIRHLAVQTKGDAIAAANRILESGASFFGAIAVQKQVVDWYVEEDRIAEWAYVGDAEEVS